MHWNWLHEIEGLNNRETAIAIWLVLLFGFLLCKPDLRKSFATVIRSFFAWKISLSYSLSVLYACAGIFVLYLLHGWTLHQFKDAFLWCTVALLKTMLKLNQVSEQKGYFKEALKENLKFTLIIEFITETYTFSLPAELILVPLLALLGGALAFAKYDKKYSSTIPFINWVLILFGLTSILHALYQVSTHFGEFANADKLREFLLPPFLAIWILPWLWLVSTIMRFETAFIRLGFKRTDKALYRLTRRTALRHFLFDPVGLERWTTDLQRRDIETPADLAESLARLRAMRAAEKKPPAVDPSLGWSPYAAKDFLKTAGFETRYYENLYEDEWGASSPYKKLQEGYPYNTLAYYVSGSQHIVTELLLTLNINAPTSEKSALADFENAARTLCHLAAVRPFPESILKKIHLKKNASINIGSHTLTLHKEGFYTDLHQYSYNFTISKN